MKIQAKTFIKKERKKKKKEKEKKCGVWGVGMGAYADDT